MLCVKIESERINSKGKIMGDLPERCDKKISA
jgi:hypothetical protein